MPQDAGLPDPASPLPGPHSREFHPVAGRIDPGPMRSAAPAGAAPPGLSANPDMMALLVALRHRWVSAVLLGCTLASIAGVGMWYLLAPKNVAFAMIKVSFDIPYIMGGGPSAPADFKTALQTAATDLTSRRVIAAALKRDEVRRLNLDFGGLDPAQVISEDVRAEFKDQSEHVSVFFTHSDPVAATTVANALKEAYMEDIVYNKTAARTKKVTELDKAYGEAVEQAKAKKESLKKLAKDLETTDPALSLQQRIETINALRDLKNEHARIGSHLINAQGALEAFDAKAEAFKKISASRSSPSSPAKVDEQAALTQAVEAAVDADNEVREVRTRLDRVQEVIDDYLRKGFTSDYRPVANARERMQALRGQLARRQSAVTAKARSAWAARPQTPAAAPPVLEDPTVFRPALVKQVERFTQLEEKLRQEIKDLSGKVAKVSVLAPEYEQLAEEIKNNEKNVGELFVKLERERIEQRAQPRITAFQEAELLKKDNKKQILAAGVAPIAVLFAVSMGLAYLEFRKRKVHKASEISRGLGIRVVGAVPRVPHLERQLVGHAGEASELEGTPVMESIDAIRTRLLHESATRSTRVVMVTSATAGEGKTTLAAALATSLARAGRKTLLLDGDLRRPTVHELFEMPVQPGFSEVLLGEVELAEAAQEVPHENLWVIPAGQWDREVLQALARDGLEGVFERLAEEFDFIVVDSHPVLAATDSLLIGRQADCVLLSVLGEVSQMPRVYAASQQLSAVGVRVLGAVVNGTDPEEMYAAPPVAANVA